MALTALTACGQQENTEAVVDEAAGAELVSGIDIDAMDKNVRPGDDFFMFMNGVWIEETEIPADKSSYGGFTVLRDDSTANVKAIIEESATGDFAKGSDEQKVGDLYKSYLDMETRNAKGTSPLQPELESIEAIESYDDLAAYFGAAVRRGLDIFTGDAVAIFMADASDDPRDLVRYYRKLEEGYECVFGSRFIPGAEIRDYPPHKLLLNRLANSFIRILFWIPFNDVTNAFKCYRRGVIEGMRPLLSHHFNLTVELPLKAIVRGYSYAVVPISWTNRASGISKLKIKEMGSRYLFIVLYLWLEKMLSRGDYHRRKAETDADAPEQERAESG